MVISSSHPSGAIALTKCRFGASNPCDLVAYQVLTACGSYLQQTGSREDESTMLEGMKVSGDHLELSKDPVQPSKADDPSLL